MSYLADEGAQGDHLLHTYVREHLDHVPSEGLPAQVGLFSEHDHQIVGFLGLRHGENPGHRPGQRASPTFIHLDQGPTSLEIEELLRIDDGKGLQLMLSQHIRQGTGSGIAGISPAFHGHKRSGPAELRFVEPVNGIHEPRVAVPRSRSPIQVMSLGRGEAA